MVGASIGTLSLCSTIKCKVIFRVQIVADGHIVACHALLRTVISGGAGTTSDGYGDLLSIRGDRQLAVIGNRNNVLSVFVNGANRSFRELRRICASVGAGGANVDCTEVCVFRSAGEAGNTLFLTIIGQRVAIGLECDILVVVELDHIFVVVRANGKRLISLAYRSVTANIFRRCHFQGRIHLHTLHSFRINFFICVVPVALNRVAQVCTQVPLCRKGNIVTGHCERGGGVSRIVVLADIFQAGHIPACKGVAGASGLAGCSQALYHMGSARYYTLRGCFIPSAAFQFISHSITRLIFGIEGGVLCQRIRELIHGVLILRVQIPAGECVGDTVNYLGGFKCFTCHIRRLCSTATFVVFTTQISIYR